MTKLKWLMAVIILAGLVNYWRPLPALKAQYDLAAPPATSKAVIDWPPDGQFALGGVGYGLLALSSKQKVQPIASTAKLMTALAVLQQKPISSKPMPFIRIRPVDVELYRKYLINGGSVVPVVASQKITEYQALQAMLIPSGNNIADSLARWAFGSDDKYLLYANQLAKQLGMTQTHFADASGFSAKTVSTAHDLALLAGAALSNPTVAKIASQKSFILAGQTYTSTNSLLGQDGINGLKTGHTDQAGGCYIFSAHRQIEGKPVTLYGAVVGASNLARAMGEAISVIKTSNAGFTKVTVVKPDQVVAHYDIPWGGRADVSAAKPLESLNWRGQPTHNDFELPNLKVPAETGAKVGKLTAIAGNHSETVELQLKNNVPEPSFLWRLFRF